MFFALPGGLPRHLQERLAQPRSDLLQGQLLDLLGEFSEPHRQGGQHVQQDLRVSRGQVQKPGPGKQIKTGDIIYLKLN